jgi:hypothetical protein
LLLPGQGVSGGRSPILIRSDPPGPIELEDSDSLPSPRSLPSPVSAGGMLVGSAGRATGRVDGPLGAIGAIGAVGGFGGFGAAAGFAALGREAGAGRLADAAFGLEEARPFGAERFTAERFPSSFPARVAVDERRAVVRFEPADLARVRLAAPRLASVFPARLAVMRLADEVDFFAVERFGADFLVADFFFAGICPPSDGAMDNRP